MTNEEKISYVRNQLSVLEQLEYAHRQGKVLIADESIEISDEKRNSLKQKFNAVRVDCVTTLNSIKID